MKILKSSLIAAFLALGMWASQASAGCNCDVPNGTPMSMCDPSVACNGLCECTQSEMQDQCCFPD
uniref:Secreted protein n=1 Tax=Candidatus Kentrum sp. UNK TaxID=2126344 RepID=A0A451AG07_9GAMM|nr:MAG: hypothetical protein BECKUNK1418G_GA0071005_105426 [Candidatus Kentron sp. UNK]VFK71356.1 MAG: hypothetical protein BECKUNK1418H_GA0071006_106124 [Candidatus Kentron sp. UNK]